MIVELIKQELVSAVKVFVHKHPEGKICYLPAWSEVINRALGHETFYFVAHQEDVVCGVLPLTYIVSRFFGSRFISQALSNYGGPLADSPQIVEMLFRQAVNTAIEKGCESVEFRNIRPLPYELFLRTEKMTMHLELTEEPDMLWKSLDTKVRNQVRKAEKSGLTVQCGGEELLNDFYSVYTVRMRQLGTPAYSLKVMKTILHMFPQNSRIFVIKKDSLVLGACFTWQFNNLAEIPWAATLVEYNSLCPNNLLYWKTIEYYCQAKAKWFDFGRCTVESSGHQFKKQWGPQPIKLNYQYWVRPGNEFAPSTPNNPKFKRYVGLWKKLPLWTTRIVGPYISRNLP